MSAEAFWTHIDEHRGSGFLYVTALTSWPRVANLYGHEGSAVVVAAFSAVCNMRFQLADASARLSLTVQAAYWREALRDDPAGALERWIPMTIHAPGTVIPVEVQSIVIERSAHHSARAVFDMARAELDAIVARLLPADRRTHLGDWAAPPTRKG